jgi:hypothetical protein
MPSHVFIHLGLWQETIDLNLRAAAAGGSAMSQPPGSPDYQLHATDYLAYGCLQSGQESKVRRMTDISTDSAGMRVGVASNAGLSEQSLHLRRVLRDVWLSRRSLESS